MMPGPYQEGTFWEYYCDWGSGKEFIHVWRLQRSLVPENENVALDVSGTVWKKWKWHEGGWYYDLWVHSETRLVLSSMESARVLSLASGSGPRARSRSRSPHGRAELDIDALAILMYGHDIRDRDL